MLGNMERNGRLLKYAVVVGMLGAGFGLTQTTNDLGIFTNAGSVGETPPGGNAHYDAAKGEYRITGGGANMWSTTDAFYFVWKQMSGDVSLSADVQWVGTSTAEHRKAAVMIRQSLDAGSAYADVAAHGSGLTALQFRGAPGEQTYEAMTQIDGPVRIRIVRNNTSYTMYAGKPDAELKEFSTIGLIGMKDPVYVGLGVCSHVATALETAIFSNVKLEQAGPAK